MVSEVGYAVSMKLPLLTVAGAVFCVLSSSNFSTAYKQKGWRVGWPRNDAACF